MNILLPPDAKYALFCDNKYAFDSEYDFTWSISFKLENPSNDQYGFCTFLSNQSTLSSFLMGQYMGFADNPSNHTIIEGYEALNGRLAIAFDSTGLFALSGGQFFDGVLPNNITPNSIIIRDTSGVIYNQQNNYLFEKINSGDDVTLRFRYINRNVVAIDIKNSNSFFENLVRVEIDTKFNNYSSIYPYFFYTSPVSSSQSTDSSFYLKNFHVQGGNAFF
jgi:hypothetical protein